MSTTIDNSGFDTAMHFSSYAPAVRFTRDYQVHPSSQHFLNKPTCSSSTCHPPAEYFSEVVNPTGKLMPRSGVVDAIARRLPRWR